MKKILAYITEEEKDEVTALASLRATYNTLLSIDAYNLDKSEIKKDLLDCNKRIEEIWFRLTSKYSIPFYVDKTLKVDYNNNYIYINE